MTTLLQDLELDLIAEKPPKWEPKVRWTSNGYLARVSTSICECNQVTFNLVGVFREEIGTNHTRRLVAATPEGAGPFRVEVEELPSTSICAQCLPAFGFTKEVVVPPTLTMQVGVGLIGTPKSRTLHATS
jgi:hypothetical protein